MLPVVVAAAPLLAEALAEALAIAGAPSDAVAVVADVGDWLELRSELPAVALVEFPLVAQGVEALLAAPVAIAFVRDASDAEAARKLGASAVVGLADGLAALIFLFEALSGQVLPGLLSSGAGAVALRRGGTGEQLTEQQWLVAVMAARGLKNHEIARELSLEVSTVKSHLHQVYVKLGINGRRQLPSPDEF